MKRVVTIVFLLFSFIITNAQVTIAVDHSAAVDSAITHNEAAKLVPVALERNDSTDFMKDSFNLYGIIAMVISIFSFIIAFLTLRAQAKTEKHTKNVPIKDQCEKFRDLSRHEYRNLCCALASAIKYFDTDNGTEKERLGYPSESNLQKLKVQPEDIVLSIDSDVAALISEMRLLLRNYNIEIDVASHHLAKQLISDATIHQDFDNILFKPLYLVKRAYELEIALVNSTAKASNKINKEALLNRTMTVILNEHLSKIAGSLTRFTTVGNPKYLNLLDSIDGDSFPTVDSTNAIHRSLQFLVKQNNSDILNTEFELTDEMKRKISVVKESINFIRNEQPDSYSHIKEYEDMLNTLLNSTRINFISIFPTIITIDAIAETVNIGMVNYQ